MKLTPRKFEDESSLTYNIFTCPMPNASYGECLVLEFKGEYGYGSKGNGDGIFMTAIIKAAAEIWEPVGLVLDFRQLDYKWGDWMTNAIFAIDSDRKDPLTNKWIEFPVTVVTSEINRPALESLLTEESKLDPDSYLFDTLELAISVVAKKAKGS